MTVFKTSILKYWINTTVPEMTMKSEAFPPLHDDTKN